MKFAYPHVFWLEALVVLLAFLHMWAERRRREALERLGDLAVVDRLKTVSLTRRAVRSGLRLAALFVLLVALARPKFGTRLEEIHRQGLDLVVAMDVSRSMLTEDVKPNRLEKAKAEVSNLIHRLRGDRVGLVAFAGTAFVQCPLTVDYGAARMFLEMMDTESIPVPGTNLADAVKAALGAFTGKGTRFRIVILITDGEHHGELPQAIIDEARQKEVRIYCIGIGRTEGGPIPIRDASGNVVDYQKDRSNKVVVSQLKPMTLEKLASSTQGRFFQATRGELELDRILEDLAKLEKSQFSSRRVEQMVDRYQWVAVLGLALLFLSLLVSERPRAEGTWHGRFS